MMDTASMPGLTEKQRSVGATSILAALAVMTTMSLSSSEAAPRLLADALSPGHPSCHARVLDATDLPARADRRVTTIALERTARDVAAERKWGTFEQFGDTPVVSATLRVRLRGDPVSHSARLACIEGDKGSLVCTSPTCAGGELRIAGAGLGKIAISIGGALKSGRFVGHYIHLDESCEGRAGSPIVLESEDDVRPFSLALAPKEACR